MSKRVSVCLSFDFDAMSSWIASFGTRSPNALSRGEFGKVGAARLLDLLRDRGLPATWFVPGHTIDAFPALCERIAREGHEIGHHGYCHENPARLDPAREREVMEMGVARIRQVTGAAPRGYRAPSGSFSELTLDLLLESGFRYDSSLLADDFTPYYCRVGDQAPPDAPYVFGRRIDLVELPFAWHLDDHPFFEPIRSRRAHNPGLAAPSHVFEVWAGEFDYLYERLGQGVYILCMHPQTIGRGHRLLLLERLLDKIQASPGVRFECMGACADAWRDAHPFEAAVAAEAEAAS